MIQSKHDAELQNLQLKLRNTSKKVEDEKDPKSWQQARNSSLNDSNKHSDEGKEPQVVNDRV